MDQEVDGVAPAPLNYTSLFNGVARFDHPQQSFPAAFWEYATLVLDHLYPYMSGVEVKLTAQQAQDIILSPEHADKSAGWPWNVLGAPTKRRAVEKFGWEQLQQYYRDHTSVVYGTLKDQLRPVGKDARFFRIMDVAAYYEALLLFHEQNVYLQDHRGCSNPMMIEYTTPGKDLSRLFNRLREHGGLLYDADGAAWDANFPLALARFICWWRSRNHPYPERVRRYYAMMYNGYTVAGGHLFALTGQPSGHLLTSVDNSLGNIILMSYHAWRNNMSVASFLAEVLFYCCGDDLAWSDRTGLFTPRAISETYASVGVFLEFTSLEPLTIEELTFVSTRPVQRVLRGTLQWTYCYDQKRLVPKLRHKRVNQKPIDRIQQLGAYCQLLFNSPAYEEMRQLMFSTIRQYAAEGLIDVLDKAVLGALESSSGVVLTRVYADSE